MFDALANLNVYQWFGLSADSHAGAALHFFVMDTVKIFVMLVVIIYVMGLLRAMLSPEKVRDFEDMQFDYVIALCDEVKLACLSFPRDAHNLHWTCSDPTQEKGARNEQLAEFRDTRLHPQQLIEGWLSGV